MNHLHDIPKDVYCTLYSAEDAAQDRQYTGHSGYVSKPQQLSQPKLTNIPNHIQNKVYNALDMVKSTGSKAKMTQEANAYADLVGMNEANRNLLVTLKTEGSSAMIKKAFEDPHEPGRTMTYAEMRSMYG